LQCCIAIILFSIFMKVLEGFVRRVKLPDRVLKWKEQGHFFNWNLETGKPCKIFYRDSAPNETNKPILILLHGFPTSSWDWNHIWDSISQREWRVIAPDFFGYGFSDKPSSKKLYYDSIVRQADMLEDLLAEITGTIRTSVFILAHDYGDSVAQELLHRSIQSSRENASRIKVKSVCFLNGGLIPGVHRPVFIQKVLASPIGFIITRFTNRRIFGNRFSGVFGVKPSKQELDEYWSIIVHNSGAVIQHCLIQYMEERVRNKTTWVDALRHEKTPLCLIDGPCDPVSGIHLAEAVADIWEIEPCTASADPVEMGKRKVIILPNQFGHYPQVECPSMVLSHFYNFMESNFPEFAQ